MAGQRCDYCSGTAMFSIRLGSDITYWSCYGDTNLALDAIVPFEDDRETDVVIMRWEQ